MNTFDLNTLDLNLFFELVEAGNSPEWAAKMATAKKDREDRKQNERDTLARNAYRNGFSNYTGD